MRKPPKPVSDFECPPGPPVTLASITETLKEIYTQEMIDELFYKERPIYALMKKKYEL